MSSVLHETESSKGGGSLPIREMHLEIAKFHTSERTQANELSGTFLRAKPINQAMTGRLGLRALRGLISLCCLVSTSALLSLHRDAWHGLRDFCVDGITTPFGPFLLGHARAEKVIWKYSDENPWENLTRTCLSVWTYYCVSSPFIVF